MLNIKRKLRKLTRKELVPENLSSQTSVSSSPLAKSYGLFLLSEDVPLDDSKVSTGVDIVAIHGLNGDAYTTWQHENRNLWLRDLLPSDLPGSRIFTYGYPSELFWSNSVATLRDYSRHLLNCLTAVSEGRERPIIFICHSLGGIVCKQALVLAHEDDRRFSDILHATSAIVFFGTPHRGSKSADLGKTVGKVVNMCLRASQVAGLTGTIRDDLLTTLGSNSQALSELAISSRHRLRDLEIVTFYENELIPGLSELVVDHHSAIMEIPGEDIIPLFADHRSMCRFKDATDNGYILALKAINRLAREALLNREMATKANRTSSNQSFSETEKSCMVLLNSIHLTEYKAQLPRPVQGTCSWILSHPAYKAWTEAEETSLLWVTGEPGCGKTMLSAFLTDHLRLNHATGPKPQVFFFFCDDKIRSQRDASAIIRGILYQIIQQDRKLIKHVKSRFELDGPSLVNSFPALWELFLKVAADSISGPITVIVDAIDECEIKTRNSFLKAVDQLVHERKGAQRQGYNCIKFLITSRPSLGNSHYLTELMRNRIPIEENQIAVSEDVKLVIRSRVGEIGNKFQFDDDMKHYLEEMLYVKSNQSFLWLHMVLHGLERSPRALKRDFEKIVNIFPQNLEATYGKFLSLITPEDQEDAGKILRLLIGASRPLTLTELNTAFTIDQIHKSAADVEDDLQLSIRSTLQDIVGSFIRIKELDHSSMGDPVVSLIHQSAKEYLTDLALRSTDRTVCSLAVPLVDAALSMSQSCIQYLLMEEFKTDLFASEGTSLESNSPLTDHLLAFADSETTDSDGPLGFDNHLGLESFFKDPRELEEAQCALISQEYRFFDYSATHWAEHYSLCEDAAPKFMREAVRQLTTNSSCALTNWLKFYWIKNNIEYSFPETFETIEVAAFFNLAMLLVETMEDIDLEDERTKVRALFWAARRSSTDCIRLLLQDGTNPNSISVDRQSPLTVSAQYGHLNAVQILLDDPSTKVALRGKSGRSALSFAAANGHLEIVEVLLERGAFSPDDQDNMHWTPLFWAVQGDYPGIVQLLLKQPSADVNRVDKSGRSVLSWAASEGACRVLKVLLKHPSIDLNLKDVQGRTPLSWAAGNGRIEVVSTLLHKTGVDKNTKDNDMRNAISWACQGGHTDTLRTLLKYGCTGVDDVDIDVWTPLLWSLFGCCPATVDALLSTRRVEIDRQDGYGRTALMWATSYGYLDVVQLLISWNANVHLKNNGGHTAVDIARLEGQVEVWEFLEAQQNEAVEKGVDLRVGT